MHRNICNKKVVVLGIDGMDPNITERLIQEGAMPNFAYLKEKGAYSRLSTTMPTETVVAWATFATGLGPGSHGIFDFIMRTPDYTPYLSLNEILNTPGKVKVNLRRKGNTFWEMLSKKRIPSYIYFCPNTFPPQPFFGKMLSGMGVPDITGTMGKFSFYTTAPASGEDKNSRGRIIHLDMKNGTVETEIYGPRLVSGNSIGESTVPLRISVMPNDAGRVLIELQGSRLSLKEGDWSDWQKLSFKIGFLQKAYGMVRFYLKSIKPEFTLYLSPVNFDPQRPLFPISYPKNYAAKLAKKVGLFYTQGMPLDTWPLSENRLDEKAFLQLVDEVLNKNKKILLSELKEFKCGLLFYYIETLDIIQHMFWRYLDSRHPLFESNSPYKDTVYVYYKKIDGLLGEVMKNLDKDTILIVLSDHGFSSFRKAVNLNRWLLEKGYLFLKPGIKESEGFLRDIDWSRTKAYALGFGGIYLNKIGREQYGVVSEREAQDLKLEISAGLKNIRDPVTGEQVVKNVYFQEDIFSGPYAENAPDLFAGFNAGYRASWQTALGGVPDVLMEENKTKWSGDHLIDFTLVPGVLFINRRIALNNPNIKDIPSSIVGLFGLVKPKELQGKNLFGDESR